MSDTGAGGPTAPGGTVSFASSAAEAFPYGFFAGSSCILKATAAVGVSGCGMFYKPENFGSLTISAS